MKENENSTTGLVAEILRSIRQRPKKGIKLYIKDIIKTTNRKKYG
jgi:hypothetical protein